jgi:hypothetical protein
MKAIKDAYEELNGDLSGTYSFTDVDIYVFWEHTGSRYICSKYRDAFSSVQYICTVEEFNNYKSEQENKVDYTSVEFWKDAPEWATEYAQYVIIGVLDKARYWLCDDGFYVVGEKVKELIVFGEEGQDDEGDNYRNHKKEDFHVISTRPTQPPVFTQEMADNGVLPSVGMEVELVVFENLTSLGHIEFKNEVGFLFRYKENNLCDFMEFSSDIAFKPLTPPITLIDGKAYQFDSHGETRNGIYGMNSLINNEGDFAITSCTNIQPLSVEVE